jgi:hypothetical protein
MQGSTSEKVGKGVGGVLVTTYVSWPKTESCPLFPTNHHPRLHSRLFHSVVVFWDDILVIGGLYLQYLSFKSFTSEPFHFGARDQTQGLAHVCNSTTELHTPPSPAFFWPDYRVASVSLVKKADLLSLIHYLAHWCKRKVSGGGPQKEQWVDSLPSLSWPSGLSANVIMDSYVPSLHFRLFSWPPTSLCIWFHILNTKRKKKLASCFIWFPLWHITNENYYKVYYKS